MVDELKVRMTDPMEDILFTSREVVVYDRNLMPLHHEGIHQVGAYEAGPSRHL